MSPTEVSSLESVQTAIERVRTEPEVNLPRLSTYSFRHKVTTIPRRAKHSHGVSEADPAASSTKYLQQFLKSRDVFRIKNAVN